MKITRCRFTRLENAGLQGSRHRLRQGQKAAADIALGAQPQDAALEGFTLEAEPGNHTAVERFAPEHRAMEATDPEAAHRPRGGPVLCWYVGC